MAITTRVHLKSPTGEIRSFGPYEMDEETHQRLVDSFAAAALAGEGQRDSVDVYQARYSQETLRGGATMVAVSLVIRASDIFFLGDGPV